MKIIYMRDILKDFWKMKLLVLICLLACVGVGLITGYKKTNFYNRISAKDKVRIEEYYERLAKYEHDVEDTEKSIEVLNDKIQELQQYIDNSIFMKLNPDNIHVINANFSTTSLIRVPDVSEDKYWNEILNISNNKDIYNINITHFSKEQALLIINRIIKKIESKYIITAPIINCYIKTDTSIVKKQKESLNNLDDYIKKRTELENVLEKQITRITKFRSEAKPKALSGKELRPISVMFRYALFAFVAGVFGLIAVFTIRHILC